MMPCYKLSLPQSMEEVLIHIDCISATDTLGLNKKYIKLVNTSFSHMVKFQTDGSLVINPKKVGYGVFTAWNLQRFWRRNVDYTHCFIKMQHCVNNVVILRNSQAAVKGLCLRGYTSKIHPMVIKMEILILEINQKGQVVLVWVPINCGIQGNETTDILTRVGVGETVVAKRIRSPNMKRDKHTSSSGGIQAKPWFWKTLWK